MSVRVCPCCSNTGAVDDRYCTCEAALALRARIDADPRIQELRAKIERELGDPQPTIYVRAGDVHVLHDTARRTREVN